MLEKLLCYKDKPLLEVLHIINDNGLGTVFVVDRDNKLLGVLTDGDIRRLMIAGHSLYEKAIDIINPVFIYAMMDERADSIISKINNKNNKINIVPIVDNKMRVVDVFVNKCDIILPITVPDLRGNEMLYIIDAFQSTWISSSGEYIERFEQEFAKYCGCSYGVAVSNGTVALHLALLVLGVGKGYEVIVPDLTFAATINVVLHANATPVIVDIDKESWCIDPQEIERAISSKTKAIIPVHIYGQPCNMDDIMAISQKHGLFVIEDCAEAHGAEFDNRKIGSFGDIGCFSFYGNKVITTGEGGMCVTNSFPLYQKMKLLRDHGMSKEKKYWHNVVGYNYRMTNIQAAIGCSQLERINTILKNRQIYEDTYRNYFADNCDITLQRNNLPKRKKITWLVSMLVEKENRSKFIDKLKAIGLEARPFFYSLSLMDIYKEFTFSSANSLQISSKGVNLPTYSLLYNLEEITAKLKGLDKR